jgi:hypothetical protein
MKNIKLNAAKSLFLIALFCPFAFADGEQGSGGFASTDAPVVKSETTLDGEQGSGGLVASTSGSYIDSVLLSLSDYFDWLV